MKTVNQNLAIAINELSETSDTAGLDATILISYATNLSRIEIITNGDNILTAKQEKLFDALIKRRKDNEPIAYLTNTKEFWGLDFAVEEGVLIPRPDTETIIATLLTILPDPKAEGTIADLGTGSGAIIISLLTEFKNMIGFATDLNEKAIKIAKINAITHKVNKRLTLLNGNWADPLKEQVNIIVSNPPYIPSNVVTTLMPDVKNYEPSSALNGGTDGLDCYKKLIPSAHKKLTGKGILVLEIGHDQNNDICNLLTNSMWKEVKSFKDLAQRNRVIVALKN